MLSQTRKSLEKRRDLYRCIRTFFHNRGYLEVETPVVVPCPGAEVHLEYFSTQWKDYHNTQLGYGPAQSFISRSYWLCLISIGCLNWQNAFEMGGNAVRGITLNL